MARFSVGDRVWVREQFPPTPPSHIRTPIIFAAMRAVERICGAFRNPEELAFVTGRLKSSVSVRQNLGHDGHGRCVDIGFEMRPGRCF